MCGRYFYLVPIQLTRMNNSELFQPEEMMLTMLRLRHPVLLSKSQALNSTSKWFNN